MTTQPRQAAPNVATAAGSLRKRRRGRIGLSSVSLALLILIWVALPAIPESTGLRFGVGFRAFFTVALLLSVAVFWLLAQERLPHPKSTAGVLASIAVVYLFTVGMLVAAAVAAPQFAVPRAQEETAEAEAAQRGERLFWRADVACFQCHTVGGRGGTRGPDQTHVAAKAGERVAGLSAKQYLLEKLKAGATYEFKVPGYMPIMPAFGQSLSSEQLDDLVAYLLSLG